MNNRFRSWLDVNIFAFTVLHPPNLFSLSVSFVLFVIGIAFLVQDWTGQAWFAVGLGLAGLSRDGLGLMKRWNQTPNARILQDAQFKELISKLALSNVSNQEGYEITELPYQAPNHSTEYVVRSAKVDSYLRGHEDVKLQVCQDSIKKLNEQLRKNANTLENILRIQYRKSWRSDPPKTFINESKTCLCDDSFLNRQDIPVYRGTYFHSFLTNELTSQVLETTDARPSVLYHGLDNSPIIKKSSGEYVLKPLGDSLAANHIGVSTLVHTGDGKLIVWRQSGSAQHSQDMLAPTGSGSCDWADWEAIVGEKTLKSLLAKAMEREFSEESNPLKTALHGITLNTRLLGYFRWVRRGGKPEFVGVTKISAPSSRLVPNVAEVCEPVFLECKYDAATIDQLMSSVRSLLESNLLSVPLWVNLKCLEEALKKDPDGWKQFLFPVSD